MSDRYYPTLDTDALAAIKLIARKLAEDPAYLLVDDCPYDEEVRKILQPQRVVASEAKSNAVVLDLETEAAALYKDLKDTAKGLGDGDSAEKMSYFRTATSLLERLITMRERASNLKQRNQFEDTVLSVLDELVPADKRTEFRNRMASFIKGGE
jgi:hypothetical protein